MGELKPYGLGIPSRVVLAHEGRFTLGKLTIEPATRLVATRERSEILEPRVMQVLVALVRANGDIVTRDELLDQCWNGRIVGEDAINRALSRIRHVASTIGEDSFRIETITKVGYRLVEQCHAAQGGPTELGAFGTRPSVCVLPFVNMSGDAEQDYFSDGISEDITTDLSKVSALSVTARNTAFQFKDQPADITAVARKLGVSHVVEGSVRKVRERIRISVQLIDGTTGNHVWAERYDRDLTDIFAIQDEITQAVVHALQLRLLPREKRSIERRGTSSAQAYDLYLMARQCRVTGYFCDLRREEAIARLCKRATEIDPEYADAWALLALAQGNLFRAYTPDGVGDDGAAAAERALALEPAIAEARLPKAWRLASEGLSGEANAELAAALALKPESWDINWEAGRLFFRQREMRIAAQCFAKAAELSDADFHSLGMLAACCTSLGEGAAMTACAEKLLRRIADVSDNGVALAYSAWAFAILGQIDSSRDRIERALLIDADNLFVRYTLAWILVTTFKDSDAAIDLLEPYLVSARQAQIWIVANDPNLDGLRDDPRFKTLLESALVRVQLPSAAITFKAVN